jgi:haloacetate dehalogenase
MFEGFETAVADLGPTTVAFRRAGAGPPLLLLHGFPETHPCGAAWLPHQPRTSQ